MKTYKHLVFDVDGTLINTERIHFASLKGVLKKIWGEDAILPDLRFSFGIPGIRTMEILELPDPEAACREWERTYIEYAEEMKTIPFDGMEEVLEKLSKTDVSLGIITSRSRREYKEDFEQQKLGDYFSCVVTASDTRRGKPYPDPMLEYLKNTGAKPEEVLFFGDSSYDMECAKGAGVDRALVLWGGIPPEEIEADYRLLEVKEILNFVKTDSSQV